MEVVAANPVNGGGGGGVSPFHNHDVCEWSCVDSLTGVLERARRETDHWTANTTNSTHKYGKVVDSRARSGVNGNLQQEARRQLEVFQSQIPGGRLQVIKTHTVSSSRWTNNFQQKTHDANTFEDLHLNLNPLDVTCQKSKAIVGRSNVGRRPPSRPRQQLNRNEQASTFDNYATTSSPPPPPPPSQSIANLYKVSRLCRQIHDNSVKQYIQKPSSVHEQQPAIGGSVKCEPNETDRRHLKRNEEGPQQTRAPLSTTSSEDNSHLTQNHHSAFSSNDTEKSTKSIDDPEKLTNDWRRTSNLRRSFRDTTQNKTCQTGKPADLPEKNGSVRKIREDIEKGRRLNAALRGSNVNLEALDQILQSLTNTPLDEAHKFQGTTETSEGKDEAEQVLIKSKKNAFVTVESIKEVRDRLRRTTSPIIDGWTCKKNTGRDGKELVDDGIVTEMSKTSQLNNKIVSSKVRSYVYGMEDSQSKRPVIGTGSLESRSKHLNSNTACRNEDWYNRRKSYGFEKMYGQHDDNIAKAKTVDSSTDSGICRSSEIPTNAPENSSWADQYYLGDGDGTFFDTPFNFNHYNCEREKWKRRDTENVIASTPVVSPYSWKLLSKESNEGDDLKRHSIAVDESKYVLKNNKEAKFRRTSLVANASDLHHFSSNDTDNFLQNRKPKKVEFCKTEVHFTAESGKVNIVETDEKPPPTHNFRRRRRNSGLMLDEFNRSDGLPVFKFGDDISNDETNAEEFSNEEDNALRNTGTGGLVTVNSNATNGAECHDIEEDPKENSEIDLPKGILKNKLTKPKPYILGDSENYLSTNLDNHEEAPQSNPWDVKLNPIRTEAPMWRSSVSVRNASFADGKIANGDSDVDAEYIESDAELTEFQKLLRTLRPVTKPPDKSSENIHGIRIVSPSTVDARIAPWSVIDRIKLVEDQQYLIANRGFSTKVNIIGNGEATVIENDTGKHLDKHPTWPRKEETSHDVKLPKIPEQLEALRKLYEDADSGSETDKEVQSLMSRSRGGNAGCADRIDEECSSVVSGSWSRISASKNLAHFKRIVATATKSAKHQRNDLHAHLEKDLDRMQSPVDSRANHTLTKKGFFNKRETQEKRNDLNLRKANVKETKHPSPIALHRKAFTSTSDSGTKLENINKLSSPALVGKSTLQNQTLCDSSTVEEGFVSSTNRKSASEKYSAKRSSLERESNKTIAEKLSAPKIRNRSPGKEILLRQPKKSEMAYFGVSISPQGTRKPIKENQLSEKPDLLQFTESDKDGGCNVKTDGDEPTYENIESTKRKQAAISTRNKRDFDSSILEELTRAADQILQAVNGYTDEDSENNRNLSLRKPLDTISETKSWRRQNDKTTNAQRPSQNRLSNSTKTRTVRLTSSNSSIESVNKETRKSSKSSGHKLSASTSSVEAKKAGGKVSNGSDNATNAKANVKARRLQRASSREALLQQSHGSSSEDLPIVVQVPLRKPRLVRKSKFTNSATTDNNSLERKDVVKSESLTNKREDPHSKNKSDVRVLAAGLPEIRHKTAVSTIRSIAERAAVRQKTEKSKTAEFKRRSLQKRDPRGMSTSTVRNDKNKNSTGRENSGQHPSSSTANVKKCIRYEAS